MGANRCIGRVGGLAAALGTGIVIVAGGTGMAWGQPSDPTSVADHDDSVTDKRPEGAGRSPARRLPQITDPSPGGAVALRRGAPVPQLGDLHGPVGRPLPAAEVRESHRGSASIQSPLETGQAAAALPDSASAPSVVSLPSVRNAAPTPDLETVSASVAPSHTTASADQIVSSGATLAAAAVPEIKSAPPSPPMATLAAGAAAPQGVAGLVSSVANLLSTGGPLVPAGAPAMWVWAAAARQELTTPAAATVAPAAAVSSSAPPTPVPAAADSTTPPTVVAVIPLDFYPGQIAVSPDSRRVYVADFWHNTVRVVDTSTNTVTGSLLLGGSAGEPLAMALSPNGNLYVADRDRGTVSVIDTSRNTVTATIPVIETRAVTATIPVGNFESGAQLAVSPDSRFAYVPYSLQGDPEAGYRARGFVAVIDTATNTIVSRIAVGDRPTGMAMSPDGRSLYVVNEYDYVDHGPDIEASYGSVSVIDTYSNTVTATITGESGGESGGLQTFGEGVAISPDGAQLYLGPGQIIDLATKRVVDRLLPSGSKVVSPDGSRLYVNGFVAGDTGKALLQVVDTSAGTTLGSVPLENSTWWNQNGSTIAASSDGKHVYAVSFVPDVGWKLTVLKTSVTGGGGTGTGGGGTSDGDPLGTALANAVGLLKTFYEEKATGADWAKFASSALGVQVSEQVGNALQKSVGLVSGLIGVVDGINTAKSGKPVTGTLKIVAGLISEVSGIVNAFWYAPQALTLRAGLWVVSLSLDAVVALANTYAPQL